MQNDNDTPLELIPTTALEAADKLKHVIAYILDDERWLGHLEYKSDEWHARLASANHAYETVKRCQIEVNR